MIDVRDRYHDELFDADVLIAFTHYYLVMQHVSE